MKPTRREWLRLAALGAVTTLAGKRVAAARVVGPPDGRQRIAQVIREFEAQGFHRTATAVDEVSGRWLADQVRAAGLPAALEPLPVERVDLQTCACTVGDRRIEGIPLFDGDFTPAEGVRGRLGAVGSDAEIGLVSTPVNRAAEGALGEARRANRHRAIIAITRGRSPGLCPCNADSFLQPFGPPVLQVSSEEETWLTAQARLGREVLVVAQATRRAAQASNVTAELKGREPSLAPVIVMTPRSGWYACASERGGGLACWLEMIRALVGTPTRRSILFVASTGHELGHLGINAFIARRPGLVPRAAAWLHLGANIGAATQSTDVLLQASDDGLDQAVTGALQAEGIKVGRRAVRTAVPAGEVKPLFLGGGRYTSILCGNLLFHHIADRGPEATNPEAIERFSRAYAAVVRSLADAT